LLQVNAGRRSHSKMQSILEHYGYAIIMAAVLVEGMGIPAPGQSLFLAGALEASQGQIDLLWLLFFVTASATIGNTIGYVIGRCFGSAALRKLRLDPMRQERLENTFHRWGGIIIVLGRFLDGFRQLNGIMAGVMRMPWWRFSVYNTIGAVLWTCFWGLGTYYVGHDFHAVMAFWRNHPWLFYAIIGAVSIALLAYLAREKAAELRRN